MNKGAQFIFFTFLVLASCQLLAKKKCNFLPEAPQSRWVSGDASVQGYFTGVGVSSKNRKSEEQIRLGRLNAVEALASSIKVSVKSHINISQSKITTDKGLQISNAMVDLAVSSVTEASLQNVSFREMWLDRESCTLWVLAVVPENEVFAQQHKELQLQLLDKAKALAKEADNLEKKETVRLDYINAALSMVESIDFSVIQTTSGKSFFISSFSSVQRYLNRQVEAQRVSAEKFAEVTALQSKMETASAGTANKLKARALAILFVLKAEYPFASVTEPVSERASFKIAELNLMSDDSCGAIMQYQLVMENSTQRSWREIANEKMLALECSENKMKKLSWRRQFEGKKVQLLCMKALPEGKSLWQRPCQELSGLLKKQGAVLETLSLPIVELYTNFENAKAGEIKSETLQVLILAEGEVRKRVSKTNPGGEDYQFSGTVYSYLIEDEEVELGDSFSVVGGWNPVSQAMAMDVLAINISKRWKKKVQSYLYGE